MRIKRKLLIRDVLRATAFAAVLLATYRLYLWRWSVLGAESIPLSMLSLAVGITATVVAAFAIEQALIGILSLGFFWVAVLTYDALFSEANAVELVKTCGSGFVVHTSLFWFVHLQRRNNRSRPTVQD